MTAVAKIVEPAKPLRSRVGDRQPVLQTPVVPQRRGLRLVVDFPLHRSLPPTRGTTTQPVLYHVLLMLVVLLLATCTVPGGSLPNYQTVSENMSESGSSYAPNPSFKLGRRWRALCANVATACATHSSHLRGAEGLAY